MWLLRDGASHGKRHVPQSVAGNVRYSSLAEHCRIVAEEADSMLVRRTDRSVRPIRNRSAEGFVARCASQLHDGFAAEALSYRGEPASACAHGGARKIERASLRQDPFPD